MTSHLPGDVDVNGMERARLEEVIGLFLEARRKLGSDGSFRIRTLLDMVLIDLGKDLARTAGAARPDDAAPERHRSNAS